ncbi:hypothetical protein Tco_0299724 [Tanacetum coccineum]
MFIKYFTNQIPPKKSRGKGSKGKKTADESHETVNVFEESEPQPKPAKKKTSNKRRVKKKVTLSADDNIISDDPDAALGLAKSISQIKARWLLKALDEGPYEFKNFLLEGSTIPRLQTVEDLEGDDLLLYDAEMELMNMILLSIPNKIYNSMDACTSTKDMWKRVERLMIGTIQNRVDRETRFTNEFDQFFAERGEALVSVYNRFAQLMNDLERNDMNFPTVTINTKFLNSLQPEWLKYVTQVCLAKRLIVDSFDDLFDYLQQFEKLVNTSKAKKLEKSHDPLALVAHTGSSSRQTSSYYVTHLTFVVDYDDEYQQDDFHNNSEDPLVSAMNSGNTERNSRRAYVQEEVVEGMNAPNETGNVQRTLRTPSSGNTLTVQCYNCSGKRHYARNCSKPRVHDSKYFMEQILLAKQGEAHILYSPFILHFNKT